MQVFPDNLLEVAQSGYKQIGKNRRIYKQGEQYAWGDDISILGYWRMDCETAETDAQDLLYKR